MRCISVAPDGSTSALVVSEAPTPELVVGHVRIAVAYAGVNRADVLQHAGHYPPPPGASNILGLEAAGVVEDVGEGVTEVRVGDRVCALADSGSYADYLVVPAGQCLVVPDSMSLEQAAACPEAVVTAASNLLLAGELSEGETLLLHGASGGVGSAAIGIARGAGARVVATASSASKADYIRALGAHEVVNYRETDFVEAVRKVTAGRGADVILDVVGAKYLKQHQKALALDGRLVVIGLLGGTRAEVNLGVLVARRQRLIGTTLRALPAQRKAELVSFVQRSVWDQVARGDVRAPVCARFDLADAGAAHDMMCRSEHHGKLVLAVDPSLA